ncbi:MAG: glutamate synthase subunit beta [Spirochaetales bacterium]|nr:glutamate synthase subunit beta [Spirochaetales bacterium]
MAKPTGFMEYGRKTPDYRPVEDRIQDFKEIEVSLTDEQLREQAARCMDCGVPFCHSYGCPLGNLVPDYSDAVYRGDWKEALDLMHSTNNFPEFTGLVCPALCEASCTLALDEAATACRYIELKIAEKGWDEGWIVPEPAPGKTGKRIAVIGSGPTGLAAAQQLARKGHNVVVLEKANRIGGILRYGIPNYKLEKWLIDRRITQMEQEGVNFEIEVEVGMDLSAKYIRKNFDAVLIATGTQKPRDIDIPGRKLEGIYFAMEMLAQQTKILLGDTIPAEELIDPKNKHVIVIGGGDTGADCVGTSIRRGCKSVIQIELLPAPPEEREVSNPWPEWPIIFRTTSSHLEAAHQEGCDRLWSILTKKFYGDSGSVKKIGCAKLEWGQKGFTEIPGSDFLLNADLVLLSMGFIPFKESKLVKDFGLAQDTVGNIQVDENYLTSVNGVFAAGDTVTGASLVVRAIDHGRKAAEGVHAYVMQHNKE